LILAAIASVFVTYVLRAWRWQALLEPLGPTRFRTAFRATVIGFMAIFLLPARIGDVLRAFLLARQDGLKPAATFATVIVERLLDLLTVLLFFAGSLFLSGVDVGSRTRGWSIVLAVAGLSLLAVLFVLAGHPERVQGWAGRLTRWLPGRLATIASHFVQTFSEGLKVMRSPSHLIAAILWSVPVWVSIAVGIWLTSRAFDLTFPFLGSFLVVGYLSVGVAIPTPGGAGGFHAFYLLALTQFFGANPAVAGAAAIVLHLVSFVPVTILGLVYMWQDGMTLGTLKGMKKEAEAAEDP
jgi:uncharacterized protein (TIRG00374 family)